jgi:hypothetical protein
MACVVGLIQLLAFEHGAKHWEDTLVESASLYTLLFVSVCAVLAVVRRRSEPLCEAVCGSFGWAVSMATGDPTAVLLTSSYIGSTLQGVRSLHKNTLFRASDVHTVPHRCCFCHSSHSMWLLLISNPHCC